VHRVVTTPFYYGDSTEMLAEMKANAKTNQEDFPARMEAKIDANQVKAVKQKEILAEISARIDTNTK
jgi:hypothetical protein